MISSVVVDLLEWKVLYWIFLSGHCTHLFLPPNSPFQLILLLQMTIKKYSWKLEKGCCTRIPTKFQFRDLPISGTSTIYLLFEKSNTDFLRDQAHQRSDSIPCWDSLTSEYGISQDLVMNLGKQAVKKCVTRSYILDVVLWSYYTLIAWKCWGVSLLEFASVTYGRKKKRSLFRIAVATPCSIRPSMRRNLWYVKRFLSKLWGMATLCSRPLWLCIGFTTGNFLKEMVTRAPIRTPTITDRKEDQTGSR